MAKFSPKFSLKIDNSQLLKRIDLLKDIGNGFTKGTANDVGAVTINNIKQLIRKGISPIRGAPRRFPAYKPSYVKQIQTSKRPEFKNKNVRPVNLFLTGKFLKALRSFVRKAPTAGYETRIGFVAGSSAAKKEQGHREGTNKQRKRPIIPTGPEQFSILIERSIIPIYVRAAEKIIKKVFN